jgi:hypothetical protein
MKVAAAAGELQGIRRANQPSQNGVKVVWPDLRTIHQGPDRVAEMQRDKLAATRGLPVWIIVVGGVALAVSYAVTAILGISDTLPGEVLGIFRPVEQPSEDARHIIIHVDGVPTGVEAGFQLGFLSLLLGGVPAAILGWALAARQSNRDRHWSGTWGNVFLAGFVFQLSSVVFTAFLLVLLLWAASDSALDTLEIVGLACIVLVFLFAVVCGLWGLRSWRVLQLQVRVTALTIAPRHGAG